MMELRRDDEALLAAAALTGFTRSSFGFLGIGLRTKLT